MQLTYGQLQPNYCKINLFMKNYLLIFSFIFIAFGAKGEGKNIKHSESILSFYALSGSGSLDINPLLNLNACTGSGTIDLNFNQGITDIIQWNDGSDDVVRVGLGEGEYSVDLTIDGCDTTIVFNLDYPDLLSVTVTDFEDKNCVTGTSSNPDLGSFTVTPVGGEGPYTYSINNSAFDISNNFTELEEGTYVVDVIDANGCEAQVSQDIRCVGCSIEGNPVLSGDDFFVNVFFGDASETAELTIYNSNGRKVIDAIDVPVVNGEVNSFPVTADLDAGMYIVLIVGDSISFSRQLIVVE